MYIFIDFKTQVQNMYVYKMEISRQIGINIQPLAASAQFLLGASHCPEGAAGGDSGFHRRRWELWGVGSLANGEMTGVKY